YVGIAAVIGACATTFGTVVAAVITLLRYLHHEEPMTPEDVGQVVKQAMADYEAARQQDET
ncbi:MAG: hypothetical protein JO222_09120, partial [Frankiales bacterium]|nr:hypothetical protein [Frankiales bacterium]